MKRRPKEAGQEEPTLSDLIGEFGTYQLSLAILTFIRYFCVAMMTNTGPLIAPAVDFWCEPPVSWSSSSSSLGPHHPSLHNKCHVERNLLNGTISQLECTKWTYNQTSAGITITDTFDLVCSRDWLRSAFQSIVSVGVVVASILFGSISDEFGRRTTLLMGCAVSLLAGLVSYWAPNFITYAISRAVCSMSDLSIAGSLFTLIVETLGSKYRGVVCISVFTGWSMGVMVMPWITSYFMNYRHVMLFTVACHVATLPWIWTIGESIRWLFVNGRSGEAHAEIRRIRAWNSMNEPSQMADKVSKLTAKHKPLNAGTRYHQSVLVRALFGGFTKVGQIFKSHELIVTTLTITWTTFSSELLYMFLIMINSDVGENVKLNYAIGGAMEILATFVSILMIYAFKNRLSLTSTLATLACSLVCLAYTHHSPEMSLWTLNIAKLASSTLSSLIYVIVTELFPTSLRQTGTGLSATLGSCGAVIAPFMRTELTNLIGLTNVILLSCLFPLSSAILIPLFLRETKGLELADDIDDIT